MRWLVPFFLTLLIPAQVLAQQGAPPGYRPVIDEAVSEFGASRWEEARALFRRAHTLYPNARTLRGIGMSSFELRDYTGAYRALNEALTNEVQPLTEEQRGQVQTLLERTRTFLAAFTFELPDGASLSVDGASVTPDPDGTILLSAGMREVRVVGADGREATARIDVAGGETGPLPIDLAPLTAPIETQAPPATRTEVRDSPNRPAQWAMIIAGVVVAAGGGTMLGLGIADVRTVEAAPIYTQWNTVADAYDRAPFLTGFGVGLLALGGAVLVTGFAWMIADGPRTVEVTAGLDRLVLRGSF